MSSSSSSIEVERKRPAVRPLKNQKFFKKEYSDNSDSDNERTKNIRHDVKVKDTLERKNITTNQQRDRVERLKRSISQEARKDSTKQQSRYSENINSKSNRYQNTHSQRDYHKNYRESISEDERRYESRKKGSKNDDYERRSSSKGKRERSRERKKRDEQKISDNKKGDKQFRDEFNQDNKYGKSERSSLRERNVAQEDKNKVSKEEENIIKEEPCWIPSGILAKFQNDYNGVTLKFTKPLDQAIPKQKWSLYPFKGEQKLEKISLKGDSAFLIGKDPKVSYVLCEHPTVSSQHAVIQFREIKKMDYASGQYLEEIRPYIIDLESKNGTFLNGKQIEPAKYIQLLPEDVLKFSLSSREYVLMLEK